MIKEFIGIIITIICIACTGGILTLGFAAQKGMIKDEYVCYILDDEEEEELI